MKLYIFYILLLIISLLNCSKSVDPPFSVRYEVTGQATSTATVTYENSSGGTNQSDISLPWEYKFSASSGTFVYISAQNTNSVGAITVRIYKDNSVFKESFSNGAYVIATASGTL